MKIPIILMIMLLIFLSVVVWKISGYDYNKIREEVQPVINAIEKYTEENRKYPESIHHLVPKYIKILPKCDLDYQYRIHGKYYLLHFGERRKLWNVYWSKDKKWHRSDFTEWPEK